MKPLPILFALTAMFFVGESLAAQEVVKGIVVDGNGNPVPGTKITVKGSETLAITSLDGSFEFTMPQTKSNKLIFNCAGMMEEKTAVKSEEKMTVTLKKRTWWNREAKFTVIALAQVPLFPTNTFNIREMAYGGMICLVKQFGGYFRINSGGGYISNTDLAGEWNDQWLTGNKVFYGNFFTGGIVYRIADPLYVYAGGGCCSVSAIYETQPDARNLQYTFKPKVGIDAGVIFKLSHFCLSAGTTFLPGKLKSEHSTNSYGPLSSLFLPTVGIGFAF